MMADDRDLIEGAQAGHADDAAVASTPVMMPRPSAPWIAAIRTYIDRRDARVGAEAEEVDAVDEHRGDRRGGAPVVDARHRAEHDEDAGDDQPARVEGGLAAERVEHPRGADEREAGAREDDAARDRIAARDQRHDDAAEADGDHRPEEDAHALGLVEAHGVDRRGGGLRRRALADGQRGGGRAPRARGELLRRQGVDRLLAHRGERGLEPPGAARLRGRGRGQRLGLGGVDAVVGVGGVGGVGGVIGVGGAVVGVEAVVGGGAAAVVGGRRLELLEGRARA